MLLVDELTKLPARTESPIGRRTELTDAEDHVVLDLVLSRSPHPTSAPDLPRPKSCRTASAAHGQPCSSSGVTVASLSTRLAGAAAIQPMRSATWLAGSASFAARSGATED